MPRSQAILSDRRLHFPSTTQAMRQQTLKNRALKLMQTLPAHPLGQGMVQGNTGVKKKDKKKEREERKKKQEEEKREKREKEKEQREQRKQDGNTSSSSAAVEVVEVEMTEEETVRSCLFAFENNAKKSSLLSLSPSLSSPGYHYYHRHEQAKLEETLSVEYKLRDTFKKLDKLPGWATGGMDGAATPAAAGSGAGDITPAVHTPGKAKADKLVAQKSCK